MAISYSLVTDRKSIRGLRKIWAQNYGAGEIEPERDTMSAVKDGYCDIIVAKEGGVIVGGTEFGIDTVEPAAIGMFGYMDVASTHRRQGIAAKLGQLAIEKLLGDALGSGRPLSVLTAEATSASEAFWNSLGFRRLYLKEVTTYTELKYVQPSLDFNEQGEPTQDVALEHLMLAGINDEINADAATKAVEAIYRWSHRWGLEDFEGNKEAYAAHNRYVDKFQREFNLQLRGAELVSLSIEERQVLIEAGATVIEYTAADEE